MTILALIKSLEAHGWDADTQVEHPSLTMGLPLEDLNVTPEERDENVAEQLKQSADSKRALIVKVSHVGGHKYAGNCIVSTLSSGIDDPLFHRVILRPPGRHLFVEIFRTLIYVSISHFLFDRSTPRLGSGSGTAESLLTMWIRLLPIPSLTV